MTEGDIHTFFDALGAGDYSAIDERLNETVVFEFPGRRFGTLIEGRRRVLVFLKQNQRLFREGLRFTVGWVGIAGDDLWPHTLAFIRTLKDADFCEITSVWDEDPKDRELLVGHTGARAFENLDAFVSGGAIMLPNGHYALCLGVGKRGQQDSVHSPEDRGRPSYPEAERGENREGESGPLHQDAHPDANVTDEIFERANPSDIPRLLPEALDSSEIQTCSAACLGLR